MPSTTSQQQSDLTLDDVMDFLVDKVMPKIDDIEARMATKEDLKSYATKDDLGKLRSDMIDHIDKKAAQASAEIAKMLYKEDEKIIATVDLLEHKQVFTKVETQKIKAMPPFAHYGNHE